MQTKPIHHHTIVVAHCKRDPNDPDFSDMLMEFMSGFIKKIKMHVLIRPIIQYGRFGFTGIAGIVTSHIAFHYFEDQRVLQFDVYSCKAYDISALMHALDDFWQIRSADVVFLVRDKGPEITRFTFRDGKLIQNPEPIKQVGIPGLPN